MTVEVIKAERIVRTILGLLEREVTLPALVWRDAAGDFRGAKNDTISIRLPSYFNARSRDLRSGDTRTKDSLIERKVDVTLDKDIYGVIAITDEELTLDIESFNGQVVAPVAGGIVRALEDELVTTMSGASYENSVEVDTSTGDGYAFNAAVDARKFLNDARVPASGRAIVLGSGLESAFLKDPQFIRADQSGSTATLREAQIGRVAGFPVFTAPGLAPDEGYAFHRTAYVMSTRAPMVPRGVPWGAVASFGGFALRVAQAVDPDELVDNFHADAWVGTNVVTDNGTINEDGQFVPSTDPDASGEADLFVRSVKLTLAAS
jgi:hypothetical protein